MEILKTNRNKSERIVSFIISLFLLPTPIIFGASEYSFSLCTIGWILLFNAVIGTCYIYRIFGVDTCKI